MPAALQDGQMNERFITVIDRHKNTDNGYRFARQPCFWAILMPQSGPGSDELMHLNSVNLYAKIM